MTTKTSAVKRYQFTAERPCGFLSKLIKPPEFDRLVAVRKAGPSIRTAGRLPTKKTPAAIGRKTQEGRLERPACFGWAIRPGRTMKA